MLGSRGVLGVDSSEFGVSWGDENVLELAVMATQSSESTKKLLNCTENKVGGEGNLK